MPVETPVRRRRRVRHRPRLIPCLLALVAVLLVIKWIDPFAPRERPLPETPDWITVELLPLNEFSRPGTPLEEVNGIVIHYVGNPGTTAAQNHSFFTNLAQTGRPTPPATSWWGWTERCSRTSRSTRWPTAPTSATTTRSPRVLPPGRQRGIHLRHL